VRAVGSIWPATLAATAAILVGIGLARFSYTPLIPALVTAQWFSPADAAYLGAANLAGYLVGAMFTARATARMNAAHVLRAMMLVVAVSFFASAFPLSFAWFFLWRFAAGVAGAALMVLAAPTALRVVPPERQGFASGIVFMGVGIGIAASGTLVPLLVRQGLVAAWCGLGALVLALTIAAWGGWPREAAAAQALPHARKASLGPALVALFIAYALNAAGLVPHMVFLVDFIARGLGQGLDAGARYWVLFGVAAMAGPVMLGRLADRIGFARCVRMAYALQAAMIVLPALVSSTLALVLSCLVVGAYVPAITMLVLGRIRELVPQDASLRKAAWSVATVAFALGQAAGAYGFSFLFAHQGSYALLYALGGAALALSLAIDAVVARR